MLKIKDNVDLKELEKYELKFNDNYGTYNYVERNCCGRTEIVINSWNRRILIEQASTIDKEVLNILYNLIKDGLVEKVEEE